MHERPEKWVDPEVYRERRLRTFKLYCDVHWFIAGNEPRQPNRRQVPIRVLKPELKQWLDDHRFPHSIRINSGGRSKITFAEKSHAMLFKLVWT